MVGSTVYGFENELYQIVALLQTLGYEVLNSHVGTIKVNPKLSNLENCLNAVDVLVLGAQGCGVCKKAVHEDKGRRQDRSEKEQLL